MHTANIKGKLYGQCALLCHCVIYFNLVHLHLQSLHSVRLTKIWWNWSSRRYFIELKKYNSVDFEFFTLDIYPNRSCISIPPVWPCFSVYCKVMSLFEHLMLNVTNETVWTSLAHKVPGALGTDHYGYGLDGILCAFVVSWRLTLPDIIRSQTRSKPRATAFARHLIIP